MCCSGGGPASPHPDFVVCVTDATNLRQNLRLVLSLKRFGLPMVVALNMTDIARRKGIIIDAARLAAELGMPVVETVGVKASGASALIEVLDSSRSSGASAAGDAVAHSRRRSKSNATRPRCAAFLSAVGGRPRSTA